jgi:hypothetical protein
MEYTHFIYAYLDPTKPGNFKYGNYIFSFEPFYIGKSKTNSVHNRMTQHLEFVKNRGIDLTNNTYKFNKIKKILDQGLDPYIVKVEEKLNLLSSFNLEKLLIEKIGMSIKGDGPLVNISPGGEGGDTFTNNPRKEDIRKMRRDQMLENNPMRGLRLEEYPSHKSKLSDNHWNKGRRPSEETKKKMSMTRKGSNNSRSYKVGKYNVNGDLIEVYDYAKKCAEINEINYSNFINRIINKDRIHNNFIYKKIK